MESFIVIYHIVLRGAIMLHYRLMTEGVLIFLAHILRVQVCKVTNQMHIKCFSGTIVKKVSPHLSKTPLHSDLPGWMPHKLCVSPVQPLARVFALQWGLELCWSSVRRSPIQRPSRAATILSIAQFHFPSNKKMVANFWHSKLRPCFSFEISCL